MGHIEMPQRISAVLSYGSETYVIVCAGTPATMALKQVTSTVPIDSRSLLNLALLLDLNPKLIAVFGKLPYTLQRRSKSRRSFVRLFAFFARCSRVWRGQERVNQ